MQAQGPELIAGLAPQDAESILALGEEITLAADQVLFDLGQAADSVYVVRTGQVALSLPLQFAGVTRDVFIEERFPGQTLGWSALIPPWKFTLKATAPLATELLKLPRAALLDHFARHPAVGYVVALNIARVVGQRLQVAQAMWAREVQHRVTAHV
jgi:CRP-like cAMP-binding protein